MKRPCPFPQGSHGAVSCITLVMLVLLPFFPPYAATLTWDADGTAGGTTGGTGTWSTSDLLWNNAGTMQAWNNAANDLALFGGTAGTVTLGSAVTANGMTFNTTGYALEGNGHMLTFGGPITVTNAGTTASIDAAITLSASTSFVGAGDLTIESSSSIAGGGTGSTPATAGFALSKSGAGTTTLGATITNAGALTVSGGVLTFSGSMTRDVYNSAAGFNVTGGTLNITGTLGTSAANPTGQSGFSGNSVTNFSGIGFFSGTSATFRIGEGSNATFNVTGGVMTLGTLSAGLVLGRSNAAAQGFLNISGGQVIVTGSATVVRIGAGYSNTETSGASVMTLSGMGLFDTGTTTGTILLGSNLAGNTASTGTLNLNGGTLATLRTITGGTAASSFFNFNGGTLKANGTTVTLATSLTTVNVRDGGGTIDTNGFNISISKALTHSVIEGDHAIDGGIIKSGAGVLTFAGTDANTYTGVTLVTAGELALSKTAGINAIAGDITLGDGSAGVLLRLINSDQIADNSVITFTGLDSNAGIFRLNGKTETLGGLSSTGGAGFVENESATSTALTLNNTGTQTFSGVLRNGTLAGFLSLIKNGLGTQILSGGNTYTGTTTINAGTLQFGADNVISTSSALVIAAAGAGTAALDLNGQAWTAGAITFYDATSTATSQGILNIGTGGLLTLSSTTFTLNADNNPLGAQINGGTLDFGGLTRTLTIADSSNALVDLNISSTITTTGGNYGLTKAGAGTLRLSGGVTLGSTLNVSNGALEISGATATGAASTTIGSVATPGILRIITGADFSTATISTGTSANASGVMIMTGGTVTLNPPTTQAGIELGRNGYGGLFQSGGTINTRRVDSWDGNAASAVAMLRVTGGVLNTANFIMLRNEHWEFTITGGEINRTGEAIALGFRSGSTTTAAGAMTVAGGVINNSLLNITLGQQNNNTALGTTHLNLNAGLLINNQIVHSNSTGAATHSYVNFNGGTLRTSNATTLISTSGSGGTGSLTAYVNGAFGTFNGGAVIDTNGLNSTLGIALLAPDGNGVSNIAVSASGSGYIGAPYVEISGGGGSGATAYAVVDLDPASASYGQITSIIVSNPGRGYTSAPTITLIGGGGTGAEIGAVTTTANTSGGLTKSGAGTLTLSGTTANTFTGMSHVKAGELALSKTAGIDAIAGNITVGDGSTGAVLRLINSDQIANSSVISFNGSGANAGIFRLNNRNETVGGLSSTGGAGVVENESGSAATSTLTVNVASGTQTFSGSLRDGDGTGTDGTLALTKSGAGTQVLSGASTYSGTTSINEGVLQISTGGTTGTGAVSVSDGGTLSGSGVIRGASFTAASGATIHAGDGTAQENHGTLTFTPASGSGSFDFQSGSTVVLGIQAGGSSDLLNFVGTGANTLLFNGNLTVTAAAFTPVAEEVFNLLDWSSLGAAPTFASRYSHTGILFGNGDEAAGFDLPDVFGTGYGWDISSFITSGSIALVVAVPEPSRMGLLGLFLVLWSIRRARQAQK